MTRRLIALLAGAALVAMLALAPTASADTVIESSTVDNGYPSALTFKLNAHADSNITDVTLNYAITGRGTSALGKPADLTPGKSVSTSVSVQTNSANSYIPVGSEFIYHWEITTADGAKFTGPDQTFFYLPPNQDWQNVKGDFMTVYYHGDKQALANAYLKAGVETYNKMAVGLLKTTLKQVPVKVILFDDEKESSQARPPTSATFDATTTTCGTKVTSDIVLVIPVSCGTADRTDTLRHEFTHIINEAAGEGPLGKLPSWLDEGTAVYGQTTPGDNFTGAFNAAVRANRLLSFASMGQAPSEANNVNLFYGQSYMAVKYLIDTFGADKYATFFATIKQGARFDQAMQQVFGYDLNGFETAFRQANGLAPQQAPSATPVRSGTATARATATPRAAAAAASNTSKSSDDHKGAIIIVGVAALFVLLAVLSLLISLMMANNRKRAASHLPPPPPPE
jgi:hypothetical protein